MSKATHRGNCQVCGHQHHVMGTTLAKHGYTVEFGFFRGTCDGSDRQPVQIERSHTDATIVWLREYAEREDSVVAQLKAGKMHPTRIKTGQELNRSTFKYEPVYIEWSAGTVEQQRKAVELAIAMSESDARHARAHAKGLAQMANLFHGRPLVAIADLEAKAAPAPQAVVDVKAGKVIGAFGSKAARKNEMDKLNREYERLHRAIQEIYLALPHGQRTEAKTEVYYGPMGLHQWRAKHSAQALKEFPQAADLVAQIEELVKAREAIKAAP